MNVRLRLSVKEIFTKLIPIYVLTAAHAPMFVPLKQSALNRVGNSYFIKESCLLKAAFFLIIVKLMIYLKVKSR